jgi:SPW repeat-containing protein
MKQIMWITIVLGVWLILAPFVFGYFGSLVPTANDVVLGVVLIACSSWMLKSLSSGLGLTAFQMLCSVWLIIAPFALMFQPWSLAMLNDVFVGIIALIVSAVEMWTVATSPVKTA